MDQAVIEELRQELLSQKERLEKNMSDLMEDSMSQERETGLDSLDESTGESLTSTRYRLRDREKYLLNKVKQALKRIESNEYPYCENCGEEIGEKRLRARPVATLCIECKEEQERNEKTFYDGHDIETDFTV